MVEVSRCLPPPRPGVYRGVPADEYHKWDAFSSSRGSVLVDRTPLSLKHQIDHGSEDTDAKMRGTLLHAAMLEPERFAREYAIGPDVKLNIKAGKDEWKAFKQANPNKILIRGADGKKITGMRARLWTHPVTSKLLREKGEHELSGIFVEPQTETVCKLRVDRFFRSKSGCRALDLKKTTNASPEAFAHRIYEYGYNRQFALYDAGLDALQLHVDQFDIIAIEEDPPHDLCVHRLTDTEREIGWEELRPVMQLYNTCRSERFWPSYGFDWQAKQYMPVPVRAPFRIRQKYGLAEAVSP